MNNKWGRSVHIRTSEITPEELYYSRRRFFAMAGLAGAGAVLAACGVPGGNVSPHGSTLSGPTAENDPAAAGSAANSGSTPERPAGADSPTTAPAVEPLTPEDAVNGFNNFYEFTTNKERVATAAAGLTVSPWNVEVSGLVRNPGTFVVEDLVKRYPPQERVYRMRCVEGWSMVIPWLGFPLGQLLRDAEPQAEARFVRFVTLYDPEQMPGQINPNYPWPYEEGLRLDEAQHDLTIIATGLYGKSLLPQTGAPLRLVVPWKYGFKSIKSIVKIELVTDQPATFWSRIAPNEYGFYSNVNPNVPHPRWSQATERRIGESDRIPTLPFNGYADQVAHLYQGMDLTKDF